MALIAQISRSIIPTMYAQNQIFRKLVNQSGWVSRAFAAARLDKHSEMASIYLYLQIYPILQ